MRFLIIIMMLFLRILRLLYYYSCSYAGTTIYCCLYDEVLEALSEYHWALPPSGDVWRAALRAGGLVPTAEYGLCHWKDMAVGFEFPLIETIYSSKFYRDAYTDTCTRTYIHAYIHTYMQDWAAAPLWKTQNPHP